MKRYLWKSDLSEANLLLHTGTKVLLYLKELVRRNSSSTVPQSKTVDLFLATTELFAGKSCGVQEGLVRVWLGGRPRPLTARGGCSRGQPWGSKEVRNGKF